MTYIVKFVLLLAFLYVAFFNFDTSKGTSAIKYSCALALTYPGWAIVVAIVVVGVSFCSWKVGGFMYREAESVERFSKRWKVGGISDARGLLKARKLLKPDILAKNDEAILNDFLVRYRKIYDALPESMKAKEQNNNLRLERKSQFFLLRINSLKVGLLFVTYEDRAPDGSVTITDHDAIPTMDEIKQIIGTSVPEDQINEAIKHVKQGADRPGAIYNPEGWGGFFANSKDLKKWSCWFLPIPLGQEYLRIIINNLELDGLL